MEVYEVLAARIDNLGISKVRLSHQLGFTQSLLEAILLGRKEISAQELILLSNYLNLGIRDFIKDGKKRAR